MPIRVATPIPIAPKPAPAQAVAPAAPPMLADQPSGFTQLEYQKEYPLPEFLARLAQEQIAGTLAGAK